MTSNNNCIFYRRTFHGTRCILLSPEDWRARRQKLLDFCTSGGRGCPVMMSYLRISINNNRKRSREQVFT
ncbi:MAG: hypothetical protein DRJ51_01650 [Thermoprotei archaeon]|nr:MAG: hypothetical protein DRJ36_01455 [Thermoprotei archaeon]RLE82333.1 MAG: hypothetical protein DRJ51_01650 [Thermoprotei archaeon]RLF03282.1 MAG: hypothetical protein DRJ59_01125 [Thermoprotei archaeon]